MKQQEIHCLARCTDVDLPFTNWSFGVVRDHGPGHERHKARCWPVVQLVKIAGIHAVKREAWNRTRYQRA